MSNSNALRQKNKESDGGLALVAGKDTGVAGRIPGGKGSRTF